MKDEKYQNYIGDLIPILKERAKEAKIAADHAEKGEETMNQGFLMAYHVLFKLMKNRADTFHIDQDELGLLDIEPDRDLICSAKRE